MSVIFLKVEVNLGVSILEAAQDAQALANKMNMPIKFDFNGVECTAFPLGNPEKLECEYLNRRECPGNYRWAHS